MMTRVVPWLLLALLLFASAAQADNVALLHGLNYLPPAAEWERWAHESLSFGVALSIWPNWWPWGEGDVRFGVGFPVPDRLNIYDDFMNLPPMAGTELFIYYFAGHGSFLQWHPVPEDPPALNDDCEEYIAVNFHPATDRMLRDDEVTSLILHKVPAGVPLLAIFSSCYAGGMMNGDDPAVNAGDPRFPFPAFPPPPVVAGDLERRVALTTVLASTSENETMPAGPEFNNAMLDALWPRWNAARARFEPKGDNPPNNPAANGDGFLTVAEFIGHILNIHPPAPGGPPIYEGEHDCPPETRGRGYGTDSILNPQHWGNYNREDSVILAHPFYIYDDADHDSLTAAQEETAGTDPLDADTDDDGLSDSEEIFRHFTDPLTWDTDLGGVGDGAEVFVGTNPRDRFDDTLTATAEEQAAKSPGRILISATPNPSNVRTTIVFELQSPASVRLEVFDIKGRSVRRIVGCEFGAGAHRRDWDGRDDAGDFVAAGIYLIQLEAGGRVESLKIALLR